MSRLIVVSNRVAPTQEGRPAAGGLAIGVLDALKEALTDKDSSVRAAVVHALALRNDRSLLPLMKAQFDDPKEGVRLRAAAGYLRVSWLKALPAKPALPEKKAALTAPAKPKQ